MPKSEAGFSSDQTPEALIRKAQPSDFSALVEMIHGLAAHHGDQATVGVSDLERDLAGPWPWAVALVAEAAEDLLGYALLTRSVSAQFGQRGLELHHLFVKRHARGQGLGQRLVAAVLGEAVTQGCSFLSLDTHAANLRAQGFYENLGFERRPPSGPRFRRKMPPSLST